MLGGVISVPVEVRRCVAVILIWFLRCSVLKYVRNYIEITFFCFSSSDLLKNLYWVPSKTSRYTHNDRPFVFMSNLSNIAVILLSHQDFIKRQNDSYVNFWRLLYDDRYDSSICHNYIIWFRCEICPYLRHKSRKLHLWFKCQIQLQTSLYTSGVVVRGKGGYVLE